MHQLSETTWPVSRPVPKLLIWAMLCVGYVAGVVLLWNDRRQNRTDTAVQKPTEISSPARV